MSHFMLDVTVIAIRQISNRGIIASSDHKAANSKGEVNFYNFLWPYRLPIQCKNRGKDNSEAEC